MQKEKIDPYGDTPEVSLKEFLNAKSGRFQEYIRAIPDRDEKELHLFRQLGEPGEGDMVKTVIPEVPLSLRMTKDFGQYRIERFHFHYSNAKTLLTFLNSLKWDSSRSPARVSIEYWPKNQSENLDNADMIQESVMISYRTESGNSQEIQLSKVFPDEMPFYAYENSGVAMADLA